MSPPRRTSWLIGPGVVLGLGLLFWFVPPFRIVSLKASRQQAVEASFSAGPFVEKLWAERLMPAAAAATDAATLVAEIRANPESARKKFARSSGLGSTYFYFVRGEGRVVASDTKGVAIALADAPSSDILLDTGPVFGNAVRDGTGLLNVSDFANSQDFNAISSEINRRIEERVLPPLRAPATVGAKIQFAGCAEITDDAPALPLRLVPLTAKVQ